MGVSKWLKNQIAGIAFAMSSVEKNAFNQKGDSLEKSITQEQKHSQGTLADSLINGVVTAEVEALRWRTYKILEAAQAFTTQILYDDNGKPFIKHVQYDKKNILKNIKQDSFDNYPLDMVVDNAPITVGGFEAIDDDNLTLTTNPILNYNVDGEIISATHGEINSIEHNANKPTNPIIIYREGLPKFQIENFTKKLHIRNINNVQKLLEFYISKYPDTENRTTRLLISEIKKAIENPRASNMLDIKEVSFISYQTIGVRDFLEFRYKIKVFDKIIEYDGYYIIKFKADIIVDGFNILEEYRVKSLDEKYEKKEKKKQ